MASSTSPALVDNSLERLPLRWVLRIRRPLVALGADDLGGLQLDEGLHHQLHGLTQEVQVAAGTQCVEEVGHSGLVEGHRVVSPP